MRGQHRAASGRSRVHYGCAHARRLHSVGRLWRRARRLGIPIAEADWEGAIDLTIDGADEVGPALELIKGGGGAFVREKIVAQASRREIIAVDETKPPVEVIVDVRRL